MIVVTGATGHLGNVLVRELVAGGAEVRALVLPDEDTSALAGMPVSLVEGNVLDLDSLVAAFEGAGVVYHLAGMISILPGRNETVWRVNVEGTKNVIEAARRCGVGRLVYTSSIHALRHTPHGEMIDEQVPFDPQTVVSDYDRSKAAASVAVLAAVEQGLDAVIVCPTGVIGPQDYRFSETGRLFRDLIHRRINFLVDGAFDFVDVRDAARGHILACQKGRSGQVYLLSGERIDLKRLFSLAQESAGVRSWNVNVPFGLAKLCGRCAPWFSRLTRRKPRFTLYSLKTVQENCWISCRKARQELGYAPRAIRETIADTVAWWQERGWGMRRPRREAA